MKIFTLILISSLCFFSAAAQNNNSTKFKKSIGLYLDRSFHGSGDLEGIKFSAVYGKYFRKRLEWSAGFSSTIHSGSFGLILDYVGTPLDASFRYTTAGLQAEGRVGFAVIKTLQHELKLTGGGLIRYQSSSFPDAYGIYFPSSTNFPEPVFTFRHNEKQNIVTIGYLADISYAYSFKNKIFAGANIGFQNDTNSDTISYYGLLVGKRF